MKRFLLRLLLSVCVCILSLSFSAKAQQQNDFKYELKGVVRDQNRAVITGLPLKINDVYSSLTDINGEFQIKLSIGNHVLTSDEVPLEKFRAFINITDKGLNPDFLEFVIDSAAIICSGNSGKLSPKITSSEQPKYPAAARAIRASGEAVVELKIAQNGSVSTAKGVRGNPLFKAISITAAKNFKFEASETAEEREVRLIFVFLLWDEKKQALKRYQCPYRIIIDSEELRLVDVNHEK